MYKEESQRELEICLFEEDFGAQTALAVCSVLLWLVAIKQFSCGDKMHRGGVAKALWGLYPQDPVGWEVKRME